MDGQGWGGDSPVCGGLGAAGDSPEVVARNGAGRGAGLRARGGTEGKWRRKEDQRDLSGPCQGDWVPAENQREVLSGAPSLRPSGSPGSAPRKGPSLLAPLAV